ncbi:uncharacterized protein T551_00762 [Pneumocystis jirovecii RU7]|uniref:Mitochondrial pyruvate carrier n=1 Tax=Pneumocystis jirovecii (strain RU7) TaxID=1408657 RepID=A0A0W4ZUR8_PNEJ7|nr:uncharacterized protein T551_00762 [Pneumocystis jirovecii RU7]KTW32080.1 hypothetical protein T551_00762 [Pneumocystis jirovecii RU7]
MSSIISMMQLKAIHLWNHPAGLKTVHFWAPTMKWGLVLAGIGDMKRSPDRLSVSQNTALTLTGLIWARWSMIVKPKNYLLAAVNLFLMTTGGIQLSRIYLYQRTLKQAGTG